MAIGQRLKQARLAAGLSQRQLCGDTITRNMLSQIENGVARPSMDTLLILAQRLGKPLSYFLEESESPEQMALEIGRQHFRENNPEAALEALKSCQSEREEYFFLTALCYLRLAETAIAQGRLPYGASLLEKCAAAGERTAYFTRELERRRCILLAKVHPEAAAVILADLPPEDEVLHLRAQVALQQQEGALAGVILDAAQDKKSVCWYMLRGQAALQTGEYRIAAEYFHRAEQAGETAAYGYLEQCYHRLEDYKMAYFYACKQK